MRRPSLTGGTAASRTRASHAILGAVLSAAGLFILADTALASLFSAAFVGAAAILVGAFEVMHALADKTWIRGLPKGLLGIFYMSIGFVLLRYEELRTVLLTYALGLALVVSGVVRISLGLGRRSGSAWLLCSGLIALAAGGAILAGWAGPGARWISVLLGVDLLLHGIAWLMVAVKGARSEPHLG